MWVVFFQPSEGCSGVMLFSIPKVHEGLEGVFLLWSHGGDPGSDVVAGGGGEDEDQVLPCDEGF